MELEISGKKYAIGKLPAMTQFHVMRRLAPVLMSMGGLAGALADGTANLVDMAGPLADAIAKLSDADSEYVINTCMVACKRVADDGKAFRVTADNGMFMFDDIDMAVMLQLTFQVIKENMANFSFAP